MDVNFIFNSNEHVIEEMEEKTQQMSLQKQVGRVENMRSLSEDVFILDSEYGYKLNGKKLHFIKYDDGKTVKMYAFDESTSFGEVASQVGRQLGEFYCLIEYLNVLGRMTIFHRMLILIFGQKYLNKLLNIVRQEFYEKQGIDLKAGDVGYGRAL